MIGRRFVRCRKKKQLQREQEPRGGKRGSKAKTEQRGDHGQLDSGIRSRMLVEVLAGVHRRRADSNGGELLFRIHSPG